MRWSIHLGTVAGTAVRLHVTFLLVPLVFGVLFYQEGGLARAIEGLGLVLSMFGCVLLHEFGHVFMARRFGVRTPDVTLLPIGGVARLERMPQKPSQEFLVAVAGPAVNVAIAAVLFVIGGWRLWSADISVLSRMSFVEQLMLVNIVLVVFNMIPAFPMDGGRVLRALLAMRMPYVKATQVAATLGQIIAVAGGLYGLLAGGSILLPFVAVFIFMAARAEASMVKVQAVLEGASLEDATEWPFLAVRPGDQLAVVSHTILAHPQPDFPVIDESGDLKGMLLRQDLLGQLMKGEGHRTVEEVMRRDVPTIPVGSSLGEGLRLLRGNGLQTLPVVNGAGGVVGLLTARGVQSLIGTRMASGSNPSGRQEGPSGTPVARYSAGGGTPPPLG